MHNIIPLPVPGRGITFQSLQMDINNAVMTVIASFAVVNCLFFYFIRRTLDKHIHSMREKISMLRREILQKEAQIKDNEVLIKELKQIDNKPNQSNCTFPNTFI